MGTRLGNIWSGLLLLVAANAAQAAIFGGHQAGFEAKYFVPQVDAEAARFLTQATFGPSRASIAQFRSSTYDGWLDQQIATPPTLARPYLDFLAAQPAPVSVSHNQRMDRWFHTASFGQDQLRQRMAFALSQILVISDRADTLNNDPYGVAEYWDILARGAFGNYRTLLEEVTKSPMMGRYLSHWRNRKVTPSAATSPSAPDENYAREIMQLFTVGLIERNIDFTPVLAGPDPIPTYDQNDITELSRVFTGWSYACNHPNTGAPLNSNCTPTASTFPDYTGFTSGPASYYPMTCYPTNMDFGAKTIIGNSVIAASADVCGVTNAGATRNDLLPALDAGQTAGQRPAALDRCHAYCVSQIDQALDYLFNHPNTAPFVSRQLIQRFVTSHPSPEYIARVATVFDNNGSGVRGDLAAVVRAILLDDEARVAPADPAAPYGKMREPLLRLTAAWRAFGVTAPAPNAASEVVMGIRNPQDSFLQRALGAPTVFNFYEPDYLPPGDLAAAGIYAPEFQIANETTAMTSANELWNRLWVGYSTSSGAFTPANVTATAYLNVADLVPLVSGANATGPTAYDAFLDEINTRLFYGTMSTDLRTKLKAFLRNSIIGAPDNVEILSTIHASVLTPEFLIQR